MNYDLKRPWIAHTVFCLIGIGLGYGIRSAGGFHRFTQAEINWDRAARRRWPGLSGWSDDQIRAMLKTPAGFRSAFDECGSKDDQEIIALGKSDLGNTYQAVYSCLPPLPKGATLNTNEGSTADPLAGIGVPVGEVKLDMSSFQPLSKPPGAVPPDWTK